MTYLLRLRTGRKVGRTLYRLNPDGSEDLIGVVDTRELAAEIAAAVNAVPDTGSPPPEGADHV